MEQAHRAAKREANKFSRQNAALGAETTKYLGRMKLLVVGLRGCGVEVAKNCLLQGVSSLTIFDPTPCAVADAGSNFFIAVEDAGRPRDVVCRPRLQELNPDATIAVADALDEALMRDVNCAVFCGPRPRDELLRWNAFCRTRTVKTVDERGAVTEEPQPVSFVWCLCAGLSTSIFVDHGPKFVVRDPDGEKPVVRLVESISSEKRGLVRFTVPDGAPATSLPAHSLYQFSEVRGPAVGAAPWPLSHDEGDPANSFRIGDTTKLAAYEGGGVITQVKRAREVSFKSLAERLANPGKPFDENGMVMTDYAFTNAEANLHASLVGLLEFAAAHGRMPKANDEPDADAVVANARAFVEACRVVNRATDRSQALDLDALDDSFARSYARHAACELQAVACFAGGVVAQEVVKCAGKYTPIDGFAHFSFFEALPTPPPPLSERAPSNSRYDDLVAVFGSRFKEKLANLNYFLVGSGALGCEFIKNFALNGVCCGPQGRLTVADADRIELSNLTRQFLFREHNVGHPKCVAAAAMAVDPGPRTCANAMNVDLKVTTAEAYVGVKTETTLFPDAFWESLDGICNALDNMEARFYVDAQCVKFEKSLLESGTMGASGNVDPIVPFKTRTYKEGGNAADTGGIPMCTLRNFPHLTDHCVEWARDKFAELFVKPAKRAVKFSRDPAGVIGELRAKLSQANDAQAVDAAKHDIDTLADMVTIATSPDLALRRQASATRAFEAFHALFRDQILDLTAAYPADARVKDKDGRDKGPFWSGHKKFPTPAQYDPDCEPHWLFLVATTHLLSQIVGGQPRKTEQDDEYAANERDALWARDLASTLVVPSYLRRAVDSTDIEGATSSTTVSADAVATQRQAALDSLARLETLGTLDLSHVQPEDFEKDDDYNFHIDFVTACANCRAQNYAIPFTDHDAAKRTAGRIVPAIATTTAAVTGLVMLELFKIVQDMPSTALRTRQVGLASNFYPSFDADNLIEQKSKVVETKPDPSELPPDAFDDDGNIKPGFTIKRPAIAYPDPHTVWTKLEAPPDAASWSLDQLVAWLRDTHHLTLTAWNLHSGYVLEDDVKRPVSTRVYPPVQALDFTKLPPLDLTKPKAMMHLQRQGVKGGLMMKYLTEWSKFKASGALPVDLP